MQAYNLRLSAGVIISNCCEFSCSTKASCREPFPCNHSLSRRWRRRKLRFSGSPNLDQSPTYRCLADFHVNRISQSEHGLSSVANLKAEIGVVLAFNLDHLRLTICLRGEAANHPAVRDQ